LALLYPIQIPWQWIIGSANPFRHKVFFAAASDFYRAPGPYLPVQPRLGLDLYFFAVYQQIRTSATCGGALSKMRQQKRPYDSIRARIFEWDTEKQKKLRDLGAFAVPFGLGSNVVH